MCGTLNGSVFPSLTRVELQDPLRCISVACGRKHILCLVEGGFVFSWGTGYLGQLGLGDDISWDSPRMIRQLDPKKLGDTVTRVVCGGSHSGVLTEGGKIYMWGLNRNGQTGTGMKVESLLEPRSVDRTDIGRKIPLDLVCGRNHTCLLTSEGRVFTWGASGFGRLGIMDTRKVQHTPREVQQFRSTPCHSLVAGDFHTVAVDIQGNVFSWGYGLEGQCGNGSTMNIRTPRHIQFPDDTVEVQELCCGSSWTFAVSTAGELYTWGYGDGGWMGICPSMDLPYVESEQPPPAPIRSHTNQGYPCQDYTRSFDSTLNVLRPSRVPMAPDRYVKWVRCGGGHALFCVGVRPTHTGEATMWSDEKDSGCNSAVDMKSARAPVSSRDSYPVAVLGSGRFGYSSARHTMESASDGGAPLGDIPVDGIHSLEDQLMSWVRHKKVPELTHALANGSVDVNSGDANGNTPIIVACQNGHMAICKILVQFGASLSIANKKGNTALHYCFAYGFTDIGEYLISVGADEYAQNNDGLTCYEGLCAADLERL